MKEIPIYEVWIQSWTMGDLLFFGTLTLVAFGVVGLWARRRARPSGDEAGLGIGETSRLAG